MGGGMGYYKYGGMLILKCLILKYMLYMYIPILGITSLCNFYEDK